MSTSECHAPFPGQREQCRFESNQKARPQSRAFSGMRVISENLVRQLEVDRHLRLDFHRLAV
jgi:hypothetical protein